MSVCGRRSVLRQILSCWKTLVIILTPILLSPLAVLTGTPAGRCAYVILIMAVYWMTEAIPIAATALIPVAVMPWLGIMGSKDLCMNYLKDTNMLFLGGLLVAVAVEKWNLHKRMALGVLLFVGSKPKWLLFGFMLTTGFLSMWLSNTATTAMMIPIAHAVLTELDNHRKSKRYAKSQSEKCQLEDGAARKLTSNDPYYYHKLPVPGTGVSAHNSSITLETSLDTIDSCHLDAPKQGAKSPGSISPSTPPVEVKIVVPPNASPRSDVRPSASPCSDVSKIDFPPENLTEEQRKEDEAFAKMSKGLTLCVAYAANIGGTATLTGTGPNLILKGQIDTLYGTGAGLNFSSWFVLAFPNMVLTLFLAWLWLQALFLGPKELFSCLVKDKGPQDKTANTVIKREYAKLGPWSFAEISTLFFFVLLALLWLSREPEFMPGWSSLFIEGYVTDACVAVAIGLCLFIFPSTRPNILCCRKQIGFGEPSEPGPVPALLDWETVHKKLPWNVIIVLGGGFALADACKQSGLSVIIGDAFSMFQGIPTWSLVLALCIITAAFTEVASNTATATIFLPILAELAGAMQIHPLYLMMPVTIATSLAFMLPVATPPNAMVFAYGTMKIIDMAKAGILMNILSILSLTVAINTWGYAYFHLGEYPEWAMDETTVRNLTTTVATVLAGASGNVQV